MLIDRILELAEHPPREPTKFETYLDEKLRQAEVIVADNISNYLYAETPQEDWNLFEDFPNTAPPFPIIFIEHSFPKYILSEKYGIIDFNIPVRKKGTLIHSELFGVPKELDEKTIIRAAFQMKLALAMAKLRLEEQYQELVKAREQLGRFKELVKYSIPEEIRKDVLKLGNGIQEETLEFAKRERIRWISRAYEFVERRDGIIIGPQKEMIWLVREDGKPVMPSLQGLLVSVFDDGLAKLASEDTDALAFLKSTTGLQVPFLTLCFMHCKNIIVRTVEAPKKLNQARVRRGHPPLAVYKILEVHPIKRILEREGNIHQVGLGKALHICRGHFKDYSLGSGLFGRAHGIYWWDMMIKGSKDEGVVLKDYKVYTK